MQTPLGLYMVSETAYEGIHEIWKDLAEDWTHEMLVAMIAHKTWMQHQLIRKLEEAEEE